MTRRPIRRSSTSPTVSSRAASWEPPFLTARPTTQDQYTAALVAMFCGGATTACPTSMAVANLYQKSGDPSWPAFSVSMNVRMNLDFQPGVVTNFRADKCAFWRTGYEAQFPH